MNKKALLEDLEVLQHLDRVLNTPRLTVLAEKLAGIVEFAFSQATLGVGQRVVLARQINFDDAPGWKMSENLLQVGALGTIKEISFYQTGFKYAVEFDDSPSSVYSFTEKYLEKVSWGVAAGPEAVPNAKKQKAATKWMQEEQETHVSMSFLDPGPSQNLLEGFSAGWDAAEKQLFDDITEETGHLTLSALIGEWRSAKNRRA